MASTWCRVGALLSLSIVSGATLAAEATPANNAPTVWQPAAPLRQIPLWPAAQVLDRPPVDGPERVVAGESLIGNKTVAMVENVTRPTMTIYPPRGTNTGTAVVVFPGGGYRVLAIDLEGTEVCGWLTTKGVTCVVLKYRVPKSGPQWDGSCECRREPATKTHMALQDAQRAIGLLRQQATSLSIDPHKIGVLGFSAGGHLVADVSNTDKLAYTPNDDADKEKVRPDFAIALYPGHLWEKHGFRINPTVHVTPKTPPTFLLQAEDDYVDDVRQSLTYYVALLHAGVPTEMHLYPRGGHAFGLRRTEQSITAWPDLAERWMESIQMLPKPSAR